MKTVKINLYKFDELSEEAQEKAIDNNRDTNVIHDWWDAIYNDARQIHAEIRGFDIGRRNYCDLSLDLSMHDVIFAILANHGGTCETYKIAKSYRIAWEEANRTAPDIFDDEDEMEYELEKMEEELKDELEDELAQEYLSMLRREYEYLTSDEAIRQYLVDTDLDFTEDGSIY